jgi:hypothetical protein
MPLLKRKTRGCDLGFSLDTSTLIADHISISENCDAQHAKPRFGPWQARVTALSSSGIGVGNPARCNPFDRHILFQLLGP